jgi:hypothetical protein
MTYACSDRREAGTLWRPVLVALLMPAIFAADFASGYEFRLSDLYCVVALMMSRVAGIRAVQATISIAVLLTLTSVADADGLSAVASVRAAISLALLGAVAIFILRGDHAVMPPQASDGGDHGEAPAAVTTPSAAPVPAPLLNELRQPLSVLLSDSRASLRWLKRDQPDLPEALLCAQRIVTNATRAGELIAAIGQRATR